MKKALLLALSIATLPLSSCDLIFGATESYMIENVATATDNLGNTIVTIAFMDDARPDFTFTVPTGTAGIDGASIKDVTAVPEGEEIVLTINYTDATKEPTVLRVPNRRGKDGIIVTGLTLGRDEEGDTTLRFTYSDGTQSPLLTIPKGMDGEDATHLISSIQTEKTEEGTQVTVSWSDGSTPIVILIPDGVDGATITDVQITNTTDTTITYTFTLSDGRIFPFEIPHESPQEWHRGVGEPPSSLGKDRDFYVDIRSGDLYAKDDGEWTYLLTIDGYGVEEPLPYHSVTFDPNGGILPNGRSQSITFMVQEESYLDRTTLHDMVGIPTKENATFIGWHTSPTYDPNSGKFDDTTKVLRDLTLYAWYDEI